jgi:uncharacterized protein YkwD
MHGGKAGRWRVTLAGIVLLVVTSCGSSAPKQTAIEPLPAPTTHPVPRSTTTTTRPRPTTTTAAPTTVPPTTPPVTRPPATFPPQTAPPPPPPPPPVAVATVVPSGAEGALVGGINSFRASHGLPPLAVHSNLVSKARAWAAHMAGGGCGLGANGVPNICHSSLSDGITVHWTRLAENVGMVSPKTNVSGMESAYEGSPAHAENMLNNQVQYVGVGVAYVGDYMYTAEEFMAG